MIPFENKLPLLINSGRFMHRHIVKSLDEPLVSRYEVYYGSTCISRLEVKRVTVHVVSAEFHGQEHISRIFIEILTMFYVSSQGNWSDVGSF